MKYTPEDEILIEEKWQELQDECRKAKVCKREDDWQFVKRAFLLAKEAHKGVRRRSGEPYIIHPIEVAIICVVSIFGFPNIVVGVKGGSCLPPRFTA